MGNESHNNVNIDSNKKEQKQNDVPESSSQRTNQKTYTQKFENIYQQISTKGTFSTGSNEIRFSPILSPSFVSNYKNSDSKCRQKPTIIRKNSFNNFKFELKPLANYKIIEIIGEGSYGKVYKATDLSTSKYVALKFIRMEHETEGFPITCIREIIILKKLYHENIVKLHDIIFDTRKQITFLVFEFMNNDLCGLLQNREMEFNEKNIYQITRQLLNGLHYCHNQNVVHRDLKTSNILVNNKGQVKIADFGLARFWQANRPFTNKVVSLWYRPIELLLGQEIYDFSADIWSLGCIICEMFQRTPLFPYNNELMMITAIYDLCGTPDFNEWNVKRHKTYLKPRPRPRNVKTTLSKYMPIRPLDLIDQMLILDPSKRITAEGALQSDWIKHMEKMKHEPMKLPNFESFEMKMKKLGHRY